MLVLIEILLVLGSRTSDFFFTPVYDYLTDMDPLKLTAQQVIRNIIR